MALTELGVVGRVEQVVYGAEPRSRPYQTTLTNAPGGAGTTVSVQDGDAWQVGDFLQGAGGELCLVTAISTDDLTVTRNIEGAENLTSGEVVKKNPRFPHEHIVAAVQEVVDELDGQGVWNLATETVAYTTEDWYDVTDTTMEDVYSVWYIDEGDFNAPWFKFHIDPANTQPKIYLSCRGFTGNVFLNYRAPYAAITDLPDRLQGMIVNGAVYKLLGGQTVLSTNDPGKRTDRTVQGGQESRDSYWFFREFNRLVRLEEADLRQRIKKLPTNRLSARARRYVP